MLGLEGAVLIPALILGSSAIIWIGLKGMRERQLRSRGGEDAAA